MTKRQLIFLGSLLLLTGFLAGLTATWYLGEEKDRQQISKLNKVMKLILSNYVDSVDSRKAVDGAIEGILTNLDPHSVYIPPKELIRVTEDFQGKFEGIGVEFRILQDTVVITNLIPGGPSLKLGIEPGDRILLVEDSTAIGLKNEEVPRRLRGPKGSKVKITVFRPSTRKKIDFVIVRDEINLVSVDAGLMLDSQTGYIKVNRFSATTADEFTSTLSGLKTKGMKRLILDLRGNTGGFLDQAAKMADEFLSGEKLIVSTRGREDGPVETLLAGEKGQFESGDLIILIDRYSASASEIVAGAIQDWDRGIIAGETSFGKGLVQKQYPLDEDNSAIRLTVARYYTPSGRLIQRPYTAGKETYYQEILSRKITQSRVVTKDDLPDSTHPRYTTKGGRVVFGGGGITPDIFISPDSTTGYLGELIRKNSLDDFTQHYLDRHRKNLLERFKTPEDFTSRFQMDETILSAFQDYAVRSGFKSVPGGGDQKKRDHYLKALFARQLYGDPGYFLVSTKTDRTVLEAMAAFSAIPDVLAIKPTGKTR